jgi:hypothetical protein
MLDPANPVGKLILRFGRIAWARVRAACDRGGVQLPKDVGELTEPGRDRLRKLLADIWFALLARRAKPTERRDQLPPDVVIDLERLRCGEELFSRRCPPKWTRRAVQKPLTEKQCLLLDALNGTALSLKELAKRLACDPSRLQRDHLKPLLRDGSVKNCKAVGGYFRVDAPPNGD